MKLLGHTITHKQAVVGGTIMAAAVALIVYIRWRAMSDAGAGLSQGVDASPNPPMTGGGAISVPAPTTDIADQYQQQLAAAQADAQRAETERMREETRQSAAAFNLQQQIGQGETDLYRASLGFLQHEIETGKEGPGAHAPKGYRFVIDPETGLPSEQKKGRGWLGNLAHAFETTFIRPVGQGIREAIPAATAGYLGGEGGTFLDAAERGYQQRQQRQLYGSQPGEGTPYGFTPPIAPPVSGYRRIVPMPHYDPYLGYAQQPNVEERF